MQEAATILRGFHDFSSFGATTGEEKSTLVDIGHLDVSESGNMILIHILGSHFLWMMVRRITGVLVQAGKGKLALKEIRVSQINTKRPSACSTTIRSIFQRVYCQENHEFHPKIPIVI
jgi:tRNA pseudouridine38-40 synthase